MTIRARVLGTAQDAGVPHVGCACARCERFRASPLLPACLGLLGARGRYLVDATPALPDQLRLLGGAPDAILLTHLHMGHVAGLLQLGPEALAARDVAVHATPAVCAVLREHAPWELLVRRGHLRLEPCAPGEAFELEPGLRAEPVEVPHRNEYGDTVAWLVSGTERRVLWLPDADAWSFDLESLLGRCDVAYLDGTFLDEGELPRQGDVPHPPIRATRERLAPRPDLLARVRFVHLNHTNGALDAAAPEIPLAVPGEEMVLG